jgi:sulfonate transport system permease protein
MSRAIWRVLLGLIVPVLVIWAYARWAADAGNLYFPPVDQIKDRFTTLWFGDGFSMNVLPSLRNLIVGYLLAVLISLAIGVFAGVNKTFRSMITPLLQIFRSVPPITLVPPLVIILGLDWGTKVVVIAIGAGLPMTVAAIDGFRRIDPETVDTADAFLVHGWLKLRKVILPAASPAILGGMQVGLQIAFILMVASEMLGSFEGIGFVTLQAQQTFISTDMWAGIVLLSLIGVILNFAFSLVRSRVLRWHSGMRAQASAA